MGWAEESRAFRATAPSSAGLRRLAAVIGEAIEVVGPLVGGTSASLHELCTPTRRLVLKRFAFADAPPLEWERLHVAHTVAVPTPEPVALDEHGSWFGAPALVVSYIPGSTMHPPQADALGRLLALIHATPVPSPVPGVLLRLPRWVTATPAVELPGGFIDAIERLRRAPQSLDTVISHCDFHPGNVLVDGCGAITGVVDWGNLRVAPRGFDVGQTRCDLAIDPGGDAPDVFLRAYEAASGTTVDGLAAWEVLAAARAFEGADAWVDSWVGAGLEMTAERIRDRAKAFGAAALGSGGPVASQP